MPSIQQAHHLPQPPRVSAERRQHTVPNKRALTLPSPPSGIEVGEEKKKTPDSPRHSGKFQLTESRIPRRDTLRKFIQLRLPIDRFASFRPC